MTMGNTLFQLVISFTLIAIGAYGGGLVAVPLIQHELVVGRGWLSFDQMAEVVAIAQMTPGPIAVNAATFVGYRQAALAGAAVATVAVVLPSLCVLGALAGVLERLKNNGRFLRVQQGLRAGVLGLLLYAAWSYGRGVVAGWTEMLLAVTAFAVLVAMDRKVHPVAVILGGGLAGLILF